MKILITGASQGIGKAAAIAFSKENHQVSICGSKEDTLKEIIKKLHGSGHNYYVIDISKENLPFPQDYDVIVHALGGTIGIKDALSSYKDYQKVWELNIGYAIHVNNFIIPSMQKRKWGRIIHISSTSHHHFRGSMPYMCAKAYLDCYVKAISRRFAGDGLVISAIAPGVIDNPENPMPEDKKNDVIKNHEPIGRLGTPDDIAPFILFMASDQCVYATGAIIEVAGGGS